ncbi:MAG: M24 family metallopeptidase [archaeon]
MKRVTETRVQTRISTSELERRWKAVRQAMKKEDIDFLVMQNFTDILGGYVKWFTDMSPRNNYPFTVLFPRDDDMTIIQHGPQAVRRSVRPGMKKEIGVPDLPTLSFSNTFEAEIVAEELAQYKKCHIGLLGLGFMQAAFYNHFTRRLDSAKFTDASDLVDNIKAIKSEEEIRLITETAHLQDATFEYSLTTIKPGRRNFEIYADVMHQILKTGSSQANLMVGSAPAGTPARLGAADRMIQQGDQVSILIESNGPNGLYTEIMGTICLGEIPSELQKDYETAQKAQEMALKLLKPGVTPSVVWEANNEFLRTAGYPEEKRLLWHGMGYDMVERPSVQLGETMKIQAGMNIAVHATASSDKAAGQVCENYLVTETGYRRLHKTPQRIYVV